MNYKEQLKSISTFEGLFEYREEIKKYKSTLPDGIENIELHQEAHFWINRVENRIKSLEREGHALDKIEESKPSEQ